MRLSVNESEESEQQQFDLARSMSDLGYYTRLGSFITARDSEYPWDANIVKSIRREFDPAWTPLFAREAWMTPTKGIVVTGRHMVARHVPNPKRESQALKVHGLPIGGWLCGIEFKTPLIEAMTLELRPAPDEVENSARGMVRQDLGEYVPFDARVYKTCQAMWHQNHSKTVRELSREIAYLQIDKPKEESAKQMEELRYRLKSDWGFLERLRETETEDDRKKAYAPKPVTPMVLVGKSAGSTPAIGAA